MQRSDVTRAELAVLETARGYVARGWTQGAYARTWDGIVVQPSDARARRWCGLGALALGLGETLGWTEITDDVLRQWSLRLLGDDLRERAPSGMWGVAEYNDRDTTTYADMLGLFDASLERHRRTLEEVLAVEEAERIVGAVAPPPPRPPVAPAPRPPVAPRAPAPVRPPMAPPPAPPIAPPGGPNGVAPRPRFLGIPVPALAGVGRW